MPENVINPDKPQFIGAVPRLSCRSADYDEWRRIYSCKPDEVMLGGPYGHYSTPLCCKIVY